jgi:hypothetical protein
MEAAMKGKIIAGSLYMIIGFVLFAVVFVFGLTVLMSLMFGSLPVHGAELTNIH